MKEASRTIDPPEEAFPPVVVVELVRDVLDVSPLPVVEVPVVVLPVVELPVDPEPDAAACCCCAHCCWAVKNFFCASTAVDPSLVIEEVKVPAALVRGVVLGT